MADTDESKQTNKKLHFHGNYWQLCGALLLVSEVPCLAKVMPAPGCHWRGLEVSTHRQQMGRGCRDAPGTTLRLQAAGELQRQAGSHGHQHCQGAGAQAWLSGQEDSAAGAICGILQDIKGLMLL